MLAPSSRRRVCPPARLTLRAFSCLLLHMLPETILQDFRCNDVPWLRRVLDRTWAPEVAEGIEENLRNPGPFPEAGLELQMGDPWPASWFPVAWSAP